MSRPSLPGAGLLASVTESSSTERRGLRRRAFSLEDWGAPAPGVLAEIPLKRSPPAWHSAEHPPALLVVAEAASVRNAVARELARDFELLNASTFASAVRQLSARPSLAAIIVDLDLSESPGPSWFLARLVDHAYDGPRILLSSVLGAEHASSQRRGSVSHFTLARPWPAGELRSSITSALGTCAPPSRPPDV